MAGVAQLVRALGCGSRGRRFNSDHSPHFEIPSIIPQKQYVLQRCFFATLPIKS